LKAVTGEEKKKYDDIARDMYYRIDDPVEKQIVGLRYAYFNDKCQEINIIIYNPEEKKRFKQTLLESDNLAQKQEVAICLVINKEDRIVDRKEYLELAGQLLIQVQDHEQGDYDKAAIDYYLRRINEYSLEK
jgi:hypothetical protein